jgi:hypothetical protein
MVGMVNAGHRRSSSVPPPLPTTGQAHPRHRVNLILTAGLARPPVLPTSIPLSPATRHYDDDHRGCRRGERVRQHPHPSFLFRPLRTRMRTAGRATVAQQRSSCACAAQ